ncbi:MAG TPA: ribonuclease HII [Acidobacteriota bacterium]|nr:ribonuclease HII [Acidobacteriota bacterium]
MRRDVTDSSDTLQTLDFERTLYAKGYGAICGVDECGRGPLAGPVVAAAVILPAEATIEGLDDSKRLTPLRRERVFEQIAGLGLVCSIGIMDHECVDRWNIHRASLMAMRKAIMDLKQNPDFVIVDGKYCIPNISHQQIAIVGGDRHCRCVSAASIIAKVSRDRMMDRYEALFPSYSFATHKGYPTPAHLRELREHGPCEIHRRTYKPVAELVNVHTLL